MAHVVGLFYHLTVHKQSWFFHWEIFYERNFQPSRICGSQLPGLNTGWYSCCIGSCSLTWTWDIPIFSLSRNWTTARTVCTMNWLMVPAALNNLLNCLSQFAAKVPHCTGNSNHQEQRHAHTRPSMIMLSSMRLSDSQHANQQSQHPWCPHKALPLKSFDPSELRLLEEFGKQTRGTQWGL